MHVLALQESRIGQISTVYQGNLTKFSFAFFLLISGLCELLKIARPGLSQHVLLLNDKRV